MSMLPSKYARTLLVSRRSGVSRSISVVEEVLIPFIDQQDTRRRSDVWSVDPLMKHTTEERHAGLASRASLCARILLALQHVTVHLDPYTHTHTRKYTLARRQSCPSAFPCINPKQPHVAGRKCTCPRMTMLMMMTILRPYSMEGEDTGG